MNGREIACHRPDEPPAQTLGNLGKGKLAVVRRQAAQQMILAEIEAWVRCAAAAEHQARPQAGLAPGNPA